MNDIVDIFYEVLTEGFKAVVPLKRTRLNDHPPWYTKRVTQLKNRHSNAHRRYKKTWKKGDYLKFCSIRNELESKQSDAYQSYLSETKNNLIQDPAKFWSYVKSKKKCDGCWNLRRKLLIPWRKVARWTRFIPTSEKHLIESVTIS